MSGPACRFHCTNVCWHADLVPLVKRSQIKGRCNFLLKRKEARRKKPTAK